MDYGVVKMNVDTDTQYAFTRPVAAHMFSNYDGVLKVDGEVGNKKLYDPRAWGKAAEAGHGRSRRRGLPEPAQRRPQAVSLSDNLLGGPEPTLPAGRLRRPGRARAGQDPPATWPRPTRRASWPGPCWPSSRWPRAARSRAYAFARTGYHRGLDALRRSGWRDTARCPGSTNPTRVSCAPCTPWAWPPQAIGEQDEAERCAQFLQDASPAAVAALQRKTRRSALTESH